MFNMNYQSQRQTYMDLAYFREYESTKQCELVFTLSLQIDNTVIKDTINAVRGNCDTVESLLQHIANKINHIIKSINRNSEICDKTDRIRSALCLVMEGSRCPINPSEKLQNLVIIGQQVYLILQVFNQSFIVIMNAPVVKNLKLPAILYALNAVQPQKLHIMFGDRPDHKVSQFAWYRSKDKISWVQVGKEFRYLMKEDDIGYYLKIVCYPCSRLCVGPPEEVVSISMVEKMADVPKCPFQERHKHTLKPVEKGLRVVSYNVLSQRYTNSDDQFAYCPQQFLSVDYRKKLTVLELAGYHADIICLQEVDAEVYKSCYSPLLKDNGYAGFFHKKGDKIPEGLALFYNIGRFQKICNAQIVYSSEIDTNPLFKDLWNSFKKNTDFKDYFKKQASSLQVVVLKETIESRKTFIIVANTHLFYHPDAEHVRLVQVHMATLCLKSLLNQYSQVGHTSLIFCGDFNFTPSSTVYKYMTTGSIDKNSEVVQKISGQLNLNNSLKLTSACGEPKFTNYTPTFKDCLDYIFIETPRMKVKKVVPFPKDEELEPYAGLPNKVYPSDHLALIVDLEVDRQTVNQII